MTKEEERDQSINDFYLMALYDIEQGYTIEELEDTLSLYEDLEEYEGCAGILKAIHEIKYDTLINIKEKQRDG